MAFIQIKKIKDGINAQFASLLEFQELNIAGTQSVSLGNHPLDIIEHTPTIYTVLESLEEPTDSPRRERFLDFKSTLVLSLQDSEATELLLDDLATRIPETINQTNNGMHLVVGGVATLRKGYARVTRFTPRYLITESDTFRIAEIVTRVVEK